MSAPGLYFIPRRVQSDDQKPCWELCYIGHAMIQEAVRCLGYERAVKILHVTGWILVFETWSGKPEPGIMVIQTMSVFWNIIFMIPYLLYLEISNPKRQDTNRVIGFRNYIFGSALEGIRSPFWQFSVLHNHTRVLASILLTNSFDFCHTHVHGNPLGLMPMRNTTINQ
jgi:hypothetical protein